MKTKRILTAILLLAAVILAACTKDYKEEDAIKYIREELGLSSYSVILSVFCLGHRFTFSLYQKIVFRSRISDYHIIQIPHIYFVNFANPPPTL